MSKVPTTIKTIFKMMSWMSVLYNSICGLITSYGLDPQFWEGVISFVFSRIAAHSRTADHSCPPADHALISNESPDHSSESSSSDKRHPFRRMVVGIMITLGLVSTVVFALYAPAEPPICKVALIKNRNFFGLCTTREALIKDIDPLERNEGWGASVLAELAGMSHGNITRVKSDLTDFLDVASWAAVLDLEVFVTTMRDELDFLLISYHEVDPYTLQFSATLTRPDRALNIADAMNKATSSGIIAREQLDLVIGAVDATYSGICIEISARKSGYFPWKWWYARSTACFDILVDTRIRLSRALFDLKKARLGLTRLLTEIDLLTGDARRDGVPESVLIKRRVLKLVGMRLTNLLRIDGEVDLVAMAGQTIFGLGPRPEAVTESRLIQKEALLISD
ncbi:hypothetical protein BDZ89DRAFT_1128059 [Hymenopellis radicata]|nr:hypothetical protein BDZ89DRAFT_1128059 [Hymenopellis radicata]